MASVTPIFDRLVAEFAESNKHYINLVGGIKPQPKNADDETVMLQLDAIALYGASQILSRSEEILNENPVRDDEPPVPVELGSKAELPRRNRRKNRKRNSNETSKTEDVPSPDDSA
jgi:hypothetical protein